ncbi:MAG: hypothetical protein SNF86_04345 [Rikenellaceae bacterium]
MMSKRVYIVAFAVVVVVAAIVIGCSDTITTREEYWEPHPDDVQLSFGVNIEEDGVTRAASISFDAFEFYIVEEGADSVTGNIFKKFDFIDNKIYIDGVEDGSYNLYILAVIGNMTSDGAALNDVSSLSDCWLEFKKDEFTSLQALYYRATVPFEIEGGNLTAALPAISLSHLLGRTTFKPQYNSEIVQYSTESIYVKSANEAVASSFSLSGEASKPKRVADIKVEGDSQIIYLPPTMEDENVSWVLTHSCNVSFLDEMESQFVVENRVESALSNNVAVSLNHKYDEYGSRYFAKGAATNYGQGDVKFTKILTKDEEPTDYVYNGTTPRKVKMKTLNTTTFNASKPELQPVFFNMKAVGNVGVYAKIDGSADRYRVIQLDSIPPLVEIDNLALAQGSKLFNTADGRWHRLNITENTILSDVEIVYAGEDEFTQFIKDIKVEFEVHFNNNASWYQAFDNGEDARECLCQMFNVAWILSQDSYWTYLHTQLTANKSDSVDYILYGDSYDEIDWDYYKSTMMSYAYFRIGRVPDGRGVAGYGWHYQFSVLEDFWLNAFGWASYKFYTIMHEIGHGWVPNDTSNHRSNLVTGNSSSAATICANYFSANMASLPFPTVASITTLRNTHTTKN